APPHGGRHGVDDCDACRGGFQSAPPHGGRPTEDTRMGKVTVSIRAPAWGATHIADEVRYRVRFQSAPPHGGRRGPRRPVLRASRVSIRAPAWGATGRPALWQAADGHAFQSAPPHGGRRACTAAIRRA